ncbi:VOC family protein [Phaeobacter porticola]|uniref:Putative enzyme related to lactoylglutathione lyase n=1 Tax=Phaeobacter porticola TaxID=1844006 RepID=A0A1L3I5R2_9RHOB|nr:VOC family protein [Phaeobacter porticola]APG47447.1 putative enzyme related to lactoylglutathione lyase [Phaeobacter porticola]
MNRAFSNILTSDVSATAQFYEDLLGMKRTGDFGWFVILSHDDMPGFELGVLDHSHKTIPVGMTADPSGIVLTFVVESVENVHKRAIDMKAEIIEGPTNLPYGQRRLMLRDPAGTAVDVSAPIV